LKKKADQLQQEVEQLKERAKELETEIIAAGTSGGVPREGLSGAVIPIEQYKEIQEKCSRFEAALYKLKDIAKNEKRELTTQITELQQEASKIPALAAQLSQVKMELEQAQTQIIELQEQVDGLTGSDAMIQELTDKNLELGEKNY